MPRMVGVLYNRGNYPFKVTGRCELESCLSGVKKMTEDFCGDQTFCSGQATVPIVLSTAAYLMLLLYW